MCNLKNKSFITFSCISILLFFFSSCKNIDQDLTTTPKEATKSTVNKGTSSIKNDSVGYSQSIIQPHRFYAGPGSIWYLYDWRFDHYEKVSGKTVGVWPVDYSVSNLITLRTKWGYSGLFIGTDQYQYDNANTANYSLNDIMVGLTGIPDANRYGIINNYGNVFAYYVDEPADQNHSMGGVLEAH